MYWSSMIQYVINGYIPVHYLSGDIFLLFRVDLGFRSILHREKKISHFDFKMESINCRQKNTLRESFWRFLTKSQSHHLRNRARDYCLCFQKSCLYLVTLFVRESFWRFLTKSQSHHLRNRVRDYCLCFQKSCLYLVTLFVRESLWRFLTKSQSHHLRNRVRDYCLCFQKSCIYLVTLFVRESLSGVTSARLPVQYIKVLFYHLLAID